MKRITAKCTNPSRRPLAIETCETRAMMAGDVAVYFDPSISKLYLTGDVAANKVQIVESGAGLKITGLDTTLNGKTASITVPAVQNVEVYLNGGDDLLQIIKGQARNVYINGGAGNDTILLSSFLAAGDITIDGADPNVATGSDDDTIIVENTTFSNVGGAGLNDALTINGGRGNDTITLAAVTGLTYGKKSDVVINGGTGNDQVTLSKVTTNNLAVDLGDGDDLLVIAAARISNLTYIDGGTGTDQFISSGNQFGLTPTIKRVEKIS